VLDAAVGVANAGNLSDLETTVLEHPPKRNIRPRTVHCMDDPLDLG
jgi:hypothetical protein